MDNDPLTRTCPTELTHSAKKGAPLAPLIDQIEGMIDLLAQTVGQLGKSRVHCQAGKLVGVTRCQALAARLSQLLFAGVGIHAQDGIRGNGGVIGISQRVVQPNACRSRFGDHVDHAVVCFDR